MFFAEAQEGAPALGAWQYHFSTDVFRRGAGGARRLRGRTSAIETAFQNANAMGMPPYALRGLQTIEGTARAGERVPLRERYSTMRATSSASTGQLNASVPVAIAARAWRPRSPSTSKNRSDSALSTAVC